MNKLKYYLYVSIFSVLFIACTNTQKTASSSVLDEFINEKSKTILVAAHRGAHNGNIENSLSSVKHAINIGVDIVELDVRVTKDGVTILMHDSKIDRTTNGTGEVKNYTLKKLKEFRLKNTKGEVSNEQIPTFEEALSLAKGKLLVDIDIKTSNVKAIVESVRKTQTQDDVFYFDNDYDGLDAIKTMDKSSKFMPRAYSLKMADSAIVRFQPEVVHIDPSFYTDEVVSLIKNNSGRVWINALGKADARIRNGEINDVMPELLGKGANIIQTDEPEIMIKYLKEKGLHN